MNDHNAVHMSTICFLVTVTAVACDATTSRHHLEPDHAAAMRDSVTQLFESIPGDLAADGPTAWLRYFEASPAFFMASDGNAVFPSSDSAVTFVNELARSVSTIQLRWIDLRVLPLSPGIAVVRAAYEETVTDTAGVDVGFGGYMTGVARHDEEGWRVQHLHWSSSAPERE